MNDTKDRPLVLGKSYEPSSPEPLPQGNLHPWTDTTPHPWRRYFARSLDIMINGGVTWWVFGFVFGFVAPTEATAFFHIFDIPGGMFIDLMMTLIAAIPVTALMIGLTGSTFGKFMFGIRVRRRDGERLGVRRALVRELKIWALGMGCGIPVVTLITMISAYNHLSGEGRAAWDETDTRVTHRTQDAFQWVLMVLGVVILIMVRVAAQLASSPSLMNVISH